MYIHQIGRVCRYVGHGMDFDSLDEVAEAIRRLGWLCTQKPQRVEDFIKLMSSSIELNFTYSAFADALMRPSRGLGSGMRLNDDGTIITDTGLVLGGKFFVHNDQGLRREPPFADLEIRVNTLEPKGGETSERYLLTITDLKGSEHAAGLQVSHNHTETMLAQELGQIRRLGRIVLRADYKQIGGRVEFDVSSILQALRSMSGVEPIKVSAEELARRYYDHQRTNNDYQLVVKHSSGARLVLTGLHGLESHDGTIAHKQLIVLEGSVISGPPSDYYRTPHVLFSIVAGDETTAEQLTNLAEALEAALWSCNY